MSCPIVLVCFESCDFIFNGILLHVHTESRRLLLHLNLGAVNYICSGFLNFFLSERKTLFTVFFSGEGNELLIL